MPAKAGAVEQRGAGAAGDVGAEPDVDAAFERRAQGKDGVGEEKIRQRAVRDTGARSCDPIEVAGR